MAKHLNRQPQFPAPKRIATELGIQYPQIVILAEAGIQSQCLLDPVLPRLAGQDSPE
jgi:hypothetical protein